MSPIFEVRWHEATGRSYVEADNATEAQDKANHGQDFGFEEFDNYDADATVEAEPLDEAEECEVRQARDCAGCDRKGDCEAGA